MVILVGVVDDFRKSDGVLTKAPTTQNDKPNTAYCPGDEEE